MAFLIFVKIRDILRIGRILAVEWRTADTPDVYVVTPVYSVLGVNTDGTATATATVTHLPRGMAFILR